MGKKFLPANLVGLFSFKRLSVLLISVFISTSGLKSQDSIIHICLGDSVTLRPTLSYETIEWKDENGNILAQTDGNGVNIVDSTPKVSPLDTLTYTAKIVRNKADNRISWGDFETNPYHATDWLTRSQYDYFPGPDPESFLMDFTRGFFTVTDNANKLFDNATHGGSYTNWHASVLDHTYGDGSGNMFSANGSTTPPIVITASVPVIAGTEYVVSAWFASTNADFSDPTVYTYDMEIWITSPSIPLGTKIGSLSGSRNNDWYQHYTFWEPTTTETVTLEFRNSQTQSGGNDFAVDDIIFAPVTIETYKIIPHAAPTVTVFDTAACYGTNIALIRQITTESDTTIASYVWSGADSILTSNTSPVPGMKAVNYPPGVYPLQITVTDNFGCTRKSPQKSVTIYELPEITGLVPLEICHGYVAGETISAKVSEGNGTIASYLWDNTNSVLTAPLNIATPALATNLPVGKHGLKLTVTDTKGCSDTFDQDSIEVLENPSITLNNQDTCYGLLKDIIASVSGGNGSYSYAWDNSNILNDTTLAKPQLASTSIDSTNYTLNLTVTDSKGCTDNATATLTIHGLPKVTVPNRDTCYGTIMTINSTYTNSGTGNVNKFTWSGATSIINAVNVPEPNLANNTIAKGGYNLTLTVQDNNGCKAKDNAVITILELPEVNVEPVKTCQGTAVTIQSSSKSVNGSIVNYTWATNPARTLSNSNTGTPQVDAINSAGIFEAILTVTDNLGCIAKDTANITINSAPAVSFPVASVCPVGGDSIAIAVVDKAAVYSYAWTNPQNILADTTVYRPVISRSVISGNYNLTLNITDTNGCKNSYTETLTILNNPKVTIADTALCFGETITYQADYNSPYALSASPFYWTGASDSIFIDHTIEDPVLKNNLPAGNYVVKLIVTDINGCTGSDTARTIAVQNAPEVVVNDKKGCEGTPVNILASVINANNGVNSYNWSYPDNPAVMSSINNTATISNVETAGSSKIKLQVTDNLGCIGSDSALITIYEIPTVSLVADTTMCPNAGEPISYPTVSNFNAIAKYQWKNTGNTLADTTVFRPLINHSKHSAGTHSFEVTVTDTNGCSAISNTTNVTLFQPPLVELNDTSICMGLPLTYNNFTVTSTQNSTYEWFGADSIFTDRLAATPVVKNSIAAGNYLLKLFVTDSIGCIGTDSISTITINELPVVIIPDYNSCVGDSVGFAANVQFGSTPYTYNWSASTVPLNNSTIQFPYLNNFNQAQGTYNLELTVTDKYGCAGSGNTANLNIYTPPTVTLEDSTDCGGNAFKLNKLVSGSNGSVQTWIWTDTDGILNNRFSNNPDIKAGSPSGAHSLILSITDSIGCKAVSNTATVTILGAPFITFNTQSSCAGDSLNIESTVTGGSGSGYVYVWSGADSILDLTAITAPKLNNLNLPAGNYTLTLQVTDNANCASSVSADINIREKPNVTLSDTSGCAGSGTTLKPIITGGSNTYTGFAWVDTAGVLNDTAIQFPKLANSNLPAGNYGVRLIVTDSYNCSDTSNYAILKIAASPNVAIKDTFECFGNPITMETSVAGGTGIPATNFSYLWTGAKILSSYNTEATTVPATTISGTYTVTLNVTDSLGCTGRGSANVTIYSLPEVSLNNQQTCEGTPLSIEQSISKNNGSIQNYNWIYNGTPLLNNNTANPIVPATESNGSYSISLAIEDSIGCISNIKSANIDVFRTPVVTLSDTSLCFGTNITLTPGISGGSGSYTKYIWTDSKGILNDTTLLNPTTDNSNKNADIYPVSLTVIDSKGCSDSTSVRNIIVHSIPQVTVQSDTICHGNPLTISASATNNMGAPVVSPKYLWKGAVEILTDSTILTPDIASSTQSAGIYMLKLTVTDNNGCVGESDAANIVIGKSPTVRLYDQETCYGDSLFISSAVFGGNKNYKYSWNAPAGFLNDNSAAKPYIANIYNMPGTYPIGLTVTDGNGCSSVTSGVNITVNAAPVANFNAAYYSGCSPLNVNFTATTPASAYTWNFGNGKQSTSASPQTIFESTVDTTFNVTLEIVSSNQCSDTVTKQISISRGIRADFSVDDFTKTYPNSIFTVTNNNYIPGTVYTWTNFDGDTSYIDPSLSHSINYNTPSLANNISYTIKLKAGMGNCADSTTRTVTVLSNKTVPVDSIFVSHSELKGCKPFDVTLGFANSYTFDTISWEINGEYVASGQMFTHTFSKTGYYNITVGGVQTNGVNATKTFQIEVNGVDDLDFRTLQDSAMLPDEKVQFHLLTHADSVLWDFGDGRYSKDNHPNHLYQYEGVYDVKVIAYNDGCVDTLIAKKAVTVYDKSFIRYPNAFAPSDASPEDGSYPVDDDINNVFHPYCTGVESYTLYIYNRWGEELFISSDILSGWNGRYGNTGKKASQGVYYWKAIGNYVNGKSWEITGDVTLIWQ